MINEREPATLDSRAKLQLLNIGVFLLFNLVYFALHFISGDRLGGPPLMFLLAAGTLGAAVYESTNIARVRSNIPLSRLVVNWIWRMSVSGILAIFIYTVFAAGIIRGVLFPDFTNSDAVFTDMTAFFQNIKPKTNADIAKALVWAFLAGYSQRFVPNIVDDLDTKAAGALANNQPNGAAG